MTNKKPIVTFSWADFWGNLISDLITIAIILSLFDVHFIPRWW